MSTQKHILTAALIALLATPLHAQEEKLQVVTTLAYLQEVVEEVGGDHVEVTTLAPLGQDPHFVQPTPARSMAVRNADVLVENGITLELWSERVIDGARNFNVRQGGPNHVFAATGIRPKQVPTQQTRAAGDVHAGGNPHVWLDPLNLKRVAQNVEQLLARVAPEHAAAFATNRASFEERLDVAFFGEDLIRILGARLLNRMQHAGRLRTFLAEREFQGAPLTDKAGGWLRRALDLEGTTLVTYHQVWTYFSDAFGIDVVITIEEKPGIPPSPSHLDRIQATAAARNTRVVACAPFYPFSRAESVAESIGGRAVQLPTQPGELDTEADLFRMFDAIFDRLEEAAGSQGE